MRGWSTLPGGPAGTRAEVQAAAQSLRVLHLVSQLHAALEVRGIRYVVLKGPVLADHYWASGDRVRTYADLDVLVAPHDVDRTRSLLEQELLAWAKPVAAGEREQSIHVPGLGPLDLHWDLCQTDELAEGFRVDVAGLLDRRVLRRLHGTDVWCLEDLDMLLHVSQHAVTAGAVSTRAWKDLDRIVRVAEPDWACLVQRARTSRQHLVTAVALRSAREVRGTPVPITALRALEARAAWPRLVRLARGCPRVAPWVSGTTRGSDAASAAALGHFLWDSWSARR